MSLLSGNEIRLGNVGFFSVGVMAFALVALQGCAPVPASSGKELSAPLAGLGRLRADEPTRVATLPTADRQIVEHTHSVPHERSFRSTCRHCGQ